MLYLIPSKCFSPLFLWVGKYLNKNAILKTKVESFFLTPQSIEKNPVLSHS